MSKELHYQLNNHRTADIQKYRPKKFLLSTFTERGFVVFSLIFFTGGITYLLNGGSIGDSSTSESSISKLLMVGIFGCTIFAIVTWHKKIIRIALREKFLWILLIIILLSFLWSAFPTATLTNSIKLIGTTLFGLYFGIRFSLKEQLQLLAWALGIGILLSLLFIMLVPSYGVMGTGDVMKQELLHAGSWRGIFGHKNVLARLMVLSANVFVLMRNRSHKIPWVGWAGLILSVILIIGSTSKTALAVLLMLMCLLPLYRALRWNNTWVLLFSIAIILIGGSAATLIISNIETIFNALGRDMSLTGRTDLWAAVLDKISERPWLGYGYSGFWREGGESDYIVTVTGFDAPHSHNGFLDLWLDLGLLGLSAFFISYITVCLKAVKWIRHIHTAEGLWPLSYLTFLFLYNLTESSLLDKSFFWILYVAVIFTMHKKSENSLNSNAY